MPPPKPLLLLTKFCSHTPGGWTEDTASLLVLVYMATKTELQ